MVFVMHKTVSLFSEIKQTENDIICFITNLKKKEIPELKIEKTF